MATSPLGANRTPPTGRLTVTSSRTGNLTGARGPVRATPPTDHAKTLSMDPLDTLAAAETVYRYATAVDRRDWVLYRSLFAETLTVDFSSYDPRLSAQQVRADEWVAGLVPLFTGLAATEHSLTNPRGMFDGDTATITMDVHAHHVFDPTDAASWYTIGGYYEDTLARVDGSWLLSGVRLVVTWRAGDPGIMGLARAEGARRLAG
jgi:SnoaL-like domain